MKEIETIHAEGHVICHDITVIIKDQIKDTAFRKGHIVTKEDIPKLLSLGKYHLYVWKGCCMKMKRPRFWRRCAGISI